VPEPIPFESRRSSPTAVLYEGRADELDGSIFVVDVPPGKGPALHVHPYPEVFVVEEGSATFTVGDEQVEASAGQFLVVPRETPHGFKNTGEGNLHVVSFHPSPEVVQTWL